MQSFVSGGCDFLQTHPAIAAQQRTTFIVAVVPRVPPFIVVALDLLSALLGLVLGLLAISSSSGKNQEVCETQSRPTIAGLIADRFEKDAKMPFTSIDEAFAEYEGERSRKIGTERTADGG